MHAGAGRLSGKGDASGPEPGLAFTIKLVQRGAAGRGQPEIDCGAMPGLDISQVAVALGKTGQLGFVQFERNAGAHRLDAVSFIDRVAPEYAPGAVQLYEPVIEPAVAGHVHLRAV